MSVDIASQTRLRVAVICPWFFRGDAVGAAARETYLRLSERTDLIVDALWTVNDYDDVHGRHCETLAELLLDPIFLQADVIIYVFAVYHAFFDAQLIGNGHGKQIVRFHNVTPKKYMPEKHWPVIERSFVQIQNFAFADQIWADSRENLEELERQGVGGPRALIIPLAVHPLITASLSDKPARRIEMIFVGRFFESKGVHELIEAADILRQTTKAPFRLRLIGNVRFSDPDYITMVTGMIASSGLEDVVEFVGSISGDELGQAYREAHIFVTGSRHEGFCVPVIEGLAAGCIPISYAVSNLRFIANDLGQLARTDTPAALAQAMKIVVEGLLEGEVKTDRRPMSPEEFDLEAAAYIGEFAPAVFSHRIYQRVREVAART